MGKTIKGDIRKKNGRKCQDLELLILLSNLREFGTWLYGKKVEEEKEDYF